MVGAALRRLHIVPGPSEGVEEALGQVSPCACAPPQVDSAQLLRIHGAQCLAQFWAALRSTLSETMPYDGMFAHFNFLDFATSWQAAKILATPNLPRVSTWFDRPRRGDVTPEVVLSPPAGLRTYRLSDAVPNADEIRRTSFLRNYLAPVGWHHYACQLYWRGNAVSTQIAIGRTREQGDFTPQEMALLEELHPHIEIILNRLFAHEEERARIRWLEHLNDQLPYPLVSLDWELQPVFANQAAYEHCAAWNYGVKDARRYRARAVFCVPPPIAAACAELKEQWVRRHSRRCKPEDSALSLTIGHPEEPDLVATIALQSASPAANPGFLIRMQSRSDSGSTQHVQAHSLFEHLTQAERELVRCVCRGLANREIAEQLGKSVKTVKGQLTSAYRKLGVPGRSRLLATFASAVS